MPNVLCLLKNKTQNKQTNKSLAYVKNSPLELLSSVYCAFPDVKSSVSDNMKTMLEQLSWESASAGLSALSHVVEPWTHQAQVLTVTLVPWAFLPCHLWVEMLNDKCLTLESG